METNITLSKLDLVKALSGSRMNGHDDYTVLINPERQMIAVNIPEADYFTMKSFDSYILEFIKDFKDEVVDGGSEPT